MDAEKVCFNEKMESSRLFQKTHCWLFSEAAESTASAMNVPLRINMLRRQWRRWRPWRRRRWRRQRGRRHNHRDESRHFYANAVKTIAVTNWLFVVKRQNGLSPVSWARLNLVIRRGSRPRLRTTQKLTPPPPFRGALNPATFDF